MEEKNYSHQSLEEVKDIKRLMERSSRFISLSGLSGVAAGVCALAGSWIAIGISVLSLAIAILIKLCK